MIEIEASGIGSFVSFQDECELVKKDKYVRYVNSITMQLHGSNRFGPQSLFCVFSKPLSW